MSDYLYDRSGEDDEVAALERTLGVYAHREPLRETGLPSRRRRTLVLASAVVAAAAAAIILVLALRDRPGTAPCQTATTGMAFATSRGTARCGGHAAQAGTLPPGTWLETTSDTVANMQVATIGDLTIYGNSKLRVVETSAREHRLELAAGRVSARVTAPPRLFVVDTPAATAVDLGCAYELTVDSDGITHLVVTAGAVSLEGDPTVAFVPAGMEVRALPGRRVGIPLASTSSAELRAAVTRFEQGDTTALSAIVEQATAVDMVTLWHLIARAPVADREAIVIKLDAYVTIPFDHDVDDMVAASPEALEEWREAIAWEWILRD